jgi:ribosomal protein L16 Arg81 hydroxylase
VNLAWEKPFHIVRLESGGDILRIPPGTFHRSVSDPDGSVVLNQAVREQGVSLVNEFRVYNSARIPALMDVTSITGSAAMFSWGGTGASGGLNQGGCVVLVGF